MLTDDGVLVADGYRHQPPHRWSRDQPDHTGGTGGPRMTMTTPPAPEPPPVLAGVRSRAGTTDRARVRLPGLRDYQADGLAAAMDGLRHGGRGQVLSACGTGKTLLATYAAVRLVEDGVVVIACPSLGLIAQTLAVWAGTGAADRLLAVCSDATVRDVALRDTAQLDCPVTTNGAAIVRFLQHLSPGQPASCRSLILTTHVSAHLVGAALAAAGVGCELLIVDEAHETTGRIDTDVAALHDDTRFAARRRLYMTATPRVLRAGPRGRVDDAGMLSMDDVSVFGPVLFRYSTARAIADGWLDDYRLVAIGVTSTEALTVLRQSGRDRPHEHADAVTRTVVMQLALAHAAAEFGLRRVLVFANSIAASRAFTHTLPGAVAAVAAAGGPLPPGRLTTGHVDGQQSIGQRRVHLEHLVEPPDGGWTVVSNVRCLSTGVDVPAVDGVGFHGRRRATIEVIQAVGRALRRSPGGSGTATILLPVLLPDDPDDADTDLGEWDTMCQVLRALRAHDEVLGDDLDQRRQSACTGPAGLPEQILLRLPDGYATEQLAQRITVRVLEGATSDWLVGYTALQAFHTRHGHVRVPTGHREHNMWLDRWISQQRAHAKAGRLPADREALLAGLGLDLDPHDTAWQRGLAAATAFHSEHGHLRVPVGYRSHGIELDQWLKQRRARHQRGTLSAERVAALDALGMTWKLKANPAQGLAAVTAFHAVHGHLNVPHGTLVDDIDVYTWLVARRVDLREGRLSTELRDRLDAMGMVWDLRGQQWRDQFAALRRFHQQNGHLRPRTNARHDGVVLSRFLAKIRKDREAGRLTADQIAAADAIGMRWEITGNRTGTGRPPRPKPVPEPAHPHGSVAATPEPLLGGPRPHPAHTPEGRSR